MAEKYYVSNSEESIRLFDNPLMEAMSKVHYSVPLFVFVPLISFLYYLGVVSGSISVLFFIAYLIGGLLTWTITEYGLHRYIFHYHPTSDFGKKIHFIFHGVHHDYPRDRLRLVMPPSVSLPLATIFFFIFKIFLVTPGLYVFFGAFLTGYLIYDMFHYAIHHLEVKGKLWNVLKTHHLKHHYNNPEKGFGVSSPIWDIIVGSDFDKGKVSH
jgi:sterol desaturase/sphingolipid hydroxylase (fatty acid hydroxylase superfamily)